MSDEQPPKGKGRGGWRPGAGRKEGTKNIRTAAIGRQVGAAASDRRANTGGDVDAALAGVPAIGGGTVGGRDFGREVRNLVASPDYRVLFPEVTLAARSAL